MPLFSFSRFLRSTDSEVYYIHSDRRRRKDGSNPAVAVLHLHIRGKFFMGALLLFQPLKEHQIDQLRAQVYLLIDDSESRDDFILSIYQADELATFSDTVDDERCRWEPPLKKDLEELDAHLLQVVGKHQVAKGLLNEHAVIEFLSSLGYAAKKADAADDHLGIDVVAENLSVIVYAQVKSGEADGRALAKLASAVATKVSEGTRQRFGLLTGERFPPHLEFLRIELEAKHGVSLACVDKATVLRSAKSYRHALG